MRPLMACWSSGSGRAGRRDTSGERRRPGHRCRGCHVVRRRQATMPAVNPTGRSHPPGHLVAVVLAAALILAVGVGPAAATTVTAPGPAATDVETVVGAHNLANRTFVQVSEAHSAGQRRDNRLVAAVAAVGSRVAPNTPSGPVRFRPPPGATAEEVAQVRAYVAGCNSALCAGQLSPTGRVSTQGALRADASRAAAAERARAAAAGSPYSGHAGHVPDTTWTGSAVPPSWMDLTPRVNTSLGGQSAHYPVGYRPTIFEFLDGG